MKCFKNYLLANKGYLFKFDLKNGYHHIDIFNSHQTYLGFSWDVEGGTKYFIFTVLLFGLSSVPRIVSFSEALRLYAVKFACFPEDGLGIANTYQDALSCSNFVKTTLINSGFVPNTTKLAWILCQRIIWLGIEIDINNNVLSIAPSRILTYSIKLNC